MKQLSSEEIYALKDIVSRIYNPEEKSVAKKNRENARKDILLDVLARLQYKYASAQPSDGDLRRMYDVVQADARLTRRVAGLGFGDTGDAYRKAALKLRILELMNVLRDGKMIRNSIVHQPGYIPSEQSTSRALDEYARASAGIDRYLNKKTGA